MAPDTWSSRQRGRRCQSQDQGQDPGAASMLSSPEMPLLSSSLCRATPITGQGQKNTTLPSVQPELQSGRAMWTALCVGFFWLLGCSLGCSGISHTQSLLCPEPLESRQHAPHAIHTNMPGAPLLKYHRNPLILLKPPPPHSLSWTLQWPLTVCHLPLTTLLIQLTAIFVGPKAPSNG